jgi:hypothetical protein
MSSLYHNTRGCQCLVGTSPIQGRSKDTGQLVPLRWMRACRTRVYKQTTNNFVKSLQSKVLGNNVADSDRPTEKTTAKQKPIDHAIDKAIALKYKSISHAAHVAVIKSRCKPFVYVNMSSDNDVLK